MELYPSSGALSPVKGVPPLSVMMARRRSGTVSRNTELPSPYDHKYRLSVKYEKHVRFLLGTTSMLLLDGTSEGCQAAAQDHTDMWVSMDGDLLVHRQTNIAQVIALPGDGLPWVTGNRPKDGAIFEKDDVCVLDGICDVTAKRLKYFGSVTTVGHAGLLDKDIKTLAKANDLSIGIIQTACLQAIGHRKSETRTRCFTEIAGWRRSINSRSCRSESIFATW